MTERFPFGPSTRPAPPFSLPLSGPSAALRLAGVAATGRKLEKPVCHYSLSWAKDEKPGPARDAADPPFPLLQTPRDRIL